MEALFEVREDPREISSNTSLTVVGVELRFGGIKALDGVSFDVEAGCWCALVGPNGSGKTSLVNVITGFYRPQAGEVMYRGIELTGRRRRGQRRPVIRTFQHPVLSGRLSLLDNVLLGAGRRDPSGKRLSFKEDGTRRDAASALLSQLDCGDYVDICADEAPYGVRKRAEIARALLGQPEVLLFDEPAAGLSSDERANVVDALRLVREKIPSVSAIVIEHDVQFVSQLCEKAVALDFGQVIAVGAMAEVLAKPKVRAAFLGEA